MEGSLIEKLVYFFILQNLLVIVKKYSDPIHSYDFQKNTANLTERQQIYYM